MSEIIERVAEAIYVAENEHSPQVRDKAMPRYRKLARVAIEAMRREPPKELVRWGTDYIWQSMLDEALK